MKKQKLMYAIGRVKFLQDLVSSREEDGYSELVDASELTQLRALLEDILLELSMEDSDE